MGKRIFRNWDRHQQRWFGKWHLYLGIIAGVIVAIVGITGSILTFRDEIDRALNPDLFTALAKTEKLSPAKAYEIFHRDHPEVTVNYIYSPDTLPTSTYIFYEYKKQRQLYINPFNGKQCGKRLYASGFINVVMNIHRTLLVPKVGTYIVGIAAMILLILTITGLRLWIPQKWKQLKNVWTVNFTAGWRRQNYDWHNVLGFYSAPVVAMLSLTGFCITFYLPIAAIVFSLSGKSFKEAANIYQVKSRYVTHADSLKLERISDIATAFFPQGRITGVSLPEDSVGSYKVYLQIPGVSRDGNRQVVAIDQYSGKILSSSRDFPPVAQGLLSWMQPLHYGTFGGMPTRILALLGGLIPAALFVTGFIIWWPRWKKQKDKLPKVKKEKPKQIYHHYFLFQLRNGFRYALWTLLLAAICGALYGLLSGIWWQPAAYAVVFLTPIVAVNFIIAVICNIVHLGCIPFGKKSKLLFRYMAVSLAFAVVFGITYTLLMNTGLHIF